MAKVLIPTDFALASRKALEFGLTIFDMAGVKADFILLNVFTLPSPSLEGWVLRLEEWKKNSILAFEELLNLVKRSHRFDHVSFETLSYIGSLENVLAYVVPERDVDCVIMGLPRSPSLEEKENEVQRIVRRLSCPILIVPTLAL